ncbi:hypothetical protein [Lachnospira multipara]|uniref:hypothetical protein n=1 Tax=Lachnospira multipara TaxID=28051 RepID=UPI000488D02B|nr:hypothetical protein [Lachnospira multipara]
MHSIITNTKKIVSLALCLILLIIGTNFGITKADDSQTGNSQTGDSKKGYKLIVADYEVNDNSISESNYFSYTTNGTDWTEITDNGTYENVLAIKLTLDQNHSLAGHTSIGSVSNNSNYTELNKSDIMTDLTTNGFTLTGDNIDRFEIHHINFNQKSNQPDPQNNDEPNTHSSFDGTVYLVWQADNQIYYHKFVLPANDPTKENKIPINTVTADNDNNVTFKIGNPYEFCYKEVEGLINTPNLEGTGQLEWLRENNYTIDPCGANCTSNSISTNGDRAFRLTIYNNDYQSFTLEANGTTYKTNADDPILTNNNMDLSDTTANKPAEMNAFLLNDTITITPDSLGSNCTISSINALNVPNTDAIVINDSGKIKFKSNYYNNVTFKIVTNDSKEYFVKINRYNTLISDSLVHGISNSNKIYANIYYDTALNPDNLEVRVKVVYKNGSTEIKNADLSDTTYLPNGEEEDGTSTTKYCTNLKMSTFYISSSNVADAYFTVIKKSDNTILSGSGYGLHYSVAQRKTIY